MEFDDYPDAYGLFQVYGPPGTGKSRFRIAFDPAVPDDTMIMVNEASKLFADVARKGRKNGVYPDWAYQQYPSLKKFVEQYSTFVPQSSNNPKEKYTMDMSGIAKMRADVEVMLKALGDMVAVVERFGGEPGDGTVIKFEHEFDAVGRSGETVYTYVAIRAASRWYVSGNPLNSRSGVKWTELLEFIGDARAWIVEEWREVPVPGAAADEGDADLTAAVANVLASRGGDDVKDVAAEVAALLNKSK